MRPIVLRAFHRPVATKWLLPNRLHSAPPLIRRWYSSSPILSSPISPSPIPSPPPSNVPRPYISAPNDAPPSPLVLEDPFVGKVGMVEHPEIKDAEFIFRSVWNSLLEKYGEENLSFPKDIMWLSGAPGSGKGLWTPLIMEYRGITSHPIEIGNLLNSPDAVAIKRRGELVGDKQVVELLFDALLKDEYKSGALVDGFPRSKEQAECMKLLYDQMQYLRAKYSTTPIYHKFHRPIFHITVLYIDREESVCRQLHRGEVAKHHNEVVKTTGVGDLMQVRETDTDPELANERYRQFTQQVYESLKIVKERFHFHFIDASGSRDEVRQRLISELEYQSSMELGDDTFESIRKVPLASEITRHARHELVRRLDHYKTRQSELFEKVINMILTDFIHIIKRQALSGKAIIRSSNPLFAESNAIDMALDVLSERGYTTVLDLKKERLPFRFVQQTGEIETKEYRVYEFQIMHPRPTIRRG